jgi:hypothetical protein
MKPVTQYQADDGTLWDTPEKATDRDTLLRQIETAMALLGREYQQPFYAINHFYQSQPCIEDRRTANPNPVNQ